jgi:hypothetical protein
MNLREEDQEPPAPPSVTELRVKRGSIGFFSRIVLMQTVVEEEDKLDLMQTVVEEEDIYLV